MIDSKTKPHEADPISQKDIEEQEYRLNVFLDIVSEADLLLMKKLMKQKNENNEKKELAA